jgi:hypothetical protein
MFDFENAIKILVACAIGAGMLLGAGFGIKALFFRRAPRSLDDEHLAEVEERLLRTEAKVGELEERLDFAERMLAESRRRAQLPGS